MVVCGEQGTFLYVWSVRNMGGLAKNKAEKIH